MSSSIEAGKPYTRVVECVETTRSYQSIPCDLYVLLDDEGMTFLPMKLAMHGCGTRYGSGEDKGQFCPVGANAVRIAFT
jgi:hypothetical protein